MGSQDSFVQDVPDLSRKNWSSQVDEALTDFPADSSICSPLVNSQTKSSSNWEGNPVIDESEAACETDSSSPNRPRDADDASSVTVTHKLSRGLTSDCL